MIVKQRENRDQLKVFRIEEFVPEEHLLRKIDSAVDFRHIYEIVEDLYCADTRLCMNDEKRQLNEYSQTRKKDTQCDIPHTEAYPKSQIGLGLNLLQ